MLEDLLWLAFELFERRRTKRDLMSFRSRSEVIADYCCTTLGEARYDGVTQEVEPVGEGRDFEIRFCLRRLRRFDDTTAMSKLCKQIM